MILRIYEGCYLLEKFDEMEDEIEDKIDLDKFIDIEYDRNYYYTNHTMDIINCFIEKDCEVVFCIVEEQLKNIDKTKADFIKERTVLINREWPYSTEKPSCASPKIIWYKTMNEFELKNELEFEWPFTCAILNINNNIKNIEYVLNVDEFTDFNVLNIIDKREGKFSKQVLPKLKELLGDKLKISDER